MEETYDWIAEQVRQAELSVEKINLMIVQAYWPDTVSSAQHVTDLCEALARDGASVTVICSGRMYESGDLICESAERRGVTIKGQSCAI